MKITTTKEKIVQAAQLAERLAGKKESLPVLSCILFEAKDGLSLKATNLEAGIDVRLPAEIEEPGSVAVNAHVLTQTLRSLSGDRVTVTQKDANLLVESRGSRTLIKAVPHAEFPALSASSGSSMAVPREKFLAGIQSVVYAASVSMIRPELGSVYVALKENALTCAATDSFRLAEKIIPGVSSASSQDILIPLKHAQELLYVLEHVSVESVSLSISDSQLVVEAEEVRYVSRVIDSQFPNYRDIIPQAFTSEATLLKSDFSEVLRKARIFSGSDQHVGFHLSASKKEFLITAQNRDVGEMSDHVDAALSGEDLDINFHISYLADCLGSIQSDSVVLGFSGPGRPVVVRAVAQEGFTYLVMPLNR